MDMQDKSKMLDKITNYCLFILIFGYMILSMLKVPIEIINIISSITSCILYTTILMRYKLKKGTIHKGLLFLGIICILAQFIGLTSSNRYFGILLLQALAHQIHQNNLLHPIHFHYSV